MTKTFGRHEHFYSFAGETKDPDALKNGLGNWLSDVTVENNEVLKNSRE